MSVNKYQRAYDTIKNSILQKEIKGPFWSTESFAAECWWNFREADLLNDKDWSELYNLYKIVNS